MSKKIIISPYSRALRNGENNCKNYPWWNEVIQLLKKEDVEILQVGTLGEKLLEGIDGHLFSASLKDVSKLISKCDKWASVDNFFQHLAHLQNKPGVVIFGKSDPKIFGYPENTNLLKDEKYLREKQFDIWENEKFSEEVFVDPDIVVTALLS